MILPIDEKWRIKSDRLKTVLSYNPNSGVFIWRRRPNPTDNRFIATWNARYADKVAGNIIKPSTIRYIKISIDSHGYYAHRLAWLYMYGSLPICGIDHIDRNGLNNRINNLRLANKSQNAANSKIKSTNSTGFKGVHMDSQGQYIAQIRRNGKKIHLGTRSAVEDAAALYAAAALDIYGDYALTPHIEILGEKGK